MEKLWPVSVSLNRKELNAERLAEFALAGVRHIEFTGSEIADFEDFLRDPRAGYDPAANNGIKIRSVHLPFLPFEEIDPASGNAAVGSRFLETQRGIVKAAASVGIEIAVVHPSAEPYSEEERPVRLACVIERLSELKKITDEYGIKLAVENLPRTCIGRDIREMTAILAAIDGLYACFDTNHSLKDDNVEFVRALGSRIIALHVSDYDFINERHRMPFDGKNDWKGIMNALKEAGYSGTWNYEVSTDGRSAAEFTENYARLLENA